MSARNFDIELTWTDGDTTSNYCEGATFAQALTQAFQYARKERNTNRPEDDVVAIKISEVREQA